MQFPLTLTTVHQFWTAFLSKNREWFFLSALLLSSLVAFLPFARQTSPSNFPIYALLPIILVFSNRERFRRIPFPSPHALALSIVFIVGSFVFNFSTGMFTENYDYGLTDYVILVIGVFTSSYSLHNRLVQIGTMTLVTLRAVTLALSMLYSEAFAAVSDFFVALVVGISRLLVSPNISAGVYPGEIVVGGAASSQSVFIGWACAGLEELVLISAILFVLISSFQLSRLSSIVWLALRIAGSFWVNIIRMVTLVWVAHDYGNQKMLWVHTHLGDVYFLIWIGVFWVVFFRFGVPPFRLRPERRAGLQESI